MIFRHFLPKIIKDFLKPMQIIDVANSKKVQRWKYLESITPMEYQGEVLLGAMKKDLSLEPVKKTITQFYKIMTFGVYYWFRLKFTKRFTDLASYNQIYEEYFEMINNYWLQIILDFLDDMYDVRELTKEQYDQRFLEAPNIALAYTKLEFLNISKKI